MFSKSIHSPEGAAFRAWLRQRREEAGLTLRQVGERLDIPHSTIAKIETGERRIDVVEYVHYCQELNVDPAEGLQVIASLKPPGGG